MGGRAVSRNTDIYATKYGGNSADYVKKSSTQVISPDGVGIETHWVENVKTGKKYDPKLKKTTD